MKVYLTSAYTEPAADFVPDWLRKHSDFSPHELVTDPAQSDLILFAETYASLDPFFFDVIRHPLYRKYQDKCVLYHYNDYPLTLCRAITPSVERRYQIEKRQHSFHYLARRRDNEALGRPYKNTAERPYLFSFVGSVETHPIRPRLLTLQHPRAFLRSTAGLVVEIVPEDQRWQFQSSYLDVAEQSSFVLCPRGLGSTSMRLFEVMELGRAPVIIGDSWVPVPGVDWQSCAVFVKEADIATIPALLEAMEPQAIEMGLRARKIWEERFAPRHAFRELVSAASELLAYPYGLKEFILDMLPLLRPARLRQASSAALRRWRYGSAAGTLAMLKGK